MLTVGIAFYLMYGGGLAVLFTLIPESRLGYLYFVSGLFILFLRFHIVSLYVLLSIVHSIIHIQWPFLTEKGYHLNHSAFADVMCHLVMMFACFVELDSVGIVPTWFRYVTIFWLSGSFFNVITAIFPVTTRQDISFLLFSWTSITQAISTGYWIGTMLWLPLVKYDYFLYQLLFQIAIACVTWAIFKRDETILAKAMHYRYVEGVHIVATWVPALWFALH